MDSTAIPSTTGSSERAHGSPPDGLNLSSNSAQSASRDGFPQRDQQESHPAQTESIDMAEKNKTVVRDLDPIDVVRTASHSDETDSDEHTLGLRDTVKQVTHSAKRKIYLHGRNRKGISKQFTPGSAPKHLRPSKQDDGDGEKAQRDPEAQLDPDAMPAPTFWQNIKIMCTTFPYWNMAFWSGWCYSIGSALFVIDGAWAWTPLAFPESEFEGESKYGVPLLFFFGACLYQVGGVMAYLEAVNDGSFAGAAMKRLLQGHQDIERELLDAKLHTFFGHIVPHHHARDEDEGHDLHSAESHTGWESIHKKDSPESVYAEAKDRVERRGGVDHGPTEEGEVREYLTWRWWPSWHALKTYHVFELGYVACAIQLFGVTLYGVTSIVILPGILSSLEWWQELAAYWIPQVVASCCFLIASIMFTIMAQDRWYLPKAGAVSWWIGIWAQVGSVGFLLCAIFGLLSNEHEWGEYQSSLSSMWGSFFYMTSGLFQWYEAINVNVGPVLAFPNNRTPVMLRKRSH